MSAHAIKLLTRPLEAKIAFFCQTKVGSVPYIDCMKLTYHPHSFLNTALVAFSLLAGGTPLYAAAAHEPSPAPAPSLTAPAAPAAAADAASDEDSPRQQRLLIRENLLYTPDQVAGYKRKIQERYGTQWVMNASYALWSPHRIRPVVDHTYQLLQGFFLFCQPIIPSRDGGTWVVAELYGACDIPRFNKRHYNALQGGLGAAANPSRGAWKGASVDILELALMQYMASGRACVLAGVLDFSCQFDAVRIANSPVGNFSNDAFVNSTILPLPECNLGCLAQVELTPSDYLQFGYTNIGCKPGDNPFSDSNRKGFVAMAEYGHYFKYPSTAFRITPFLLGNRYRSKGLSHRHNIGFNVGMEWAPNDVAEFFVRTGWAARQELGNAFDFSLGTRLHFFSSRPQDFLGLAAAIIKGRAPYVETLEDGATLPGHHREYVLEGVYSFGLARGLKVVPHAQLVLDPSYRHVPCETILGVQLTYTF